MVVIRAGINKMLLKIANGEDTDIRLLKKQTALFDFVSRGLFNRQLVVKYENIYMYHVHTLANSEATTQVLL